MHRMNLPVKKTLSVLLTASLLLSASGTLPSLAASGPAIPIAVELSSFNGVVSNDVNGNTLLLYKGNDAGNPYLKGTNLLVAPNVNNKSGTVVRRNRMKLTDGFSTYFQFNLNSGSTPPADGLTFVIYKAEVAQPLVGGYGSGIGYAGIPNSIGVEFDLYKNNNKTAPGEKREAYLKDGKTDVYVMTDDPAAVTGGDANENTVYHVAIDTNGDVYHTGVASSTSTNAANPTNDGASNIAHRYAKLYNNDVNVWIDYNGGVVTVTYGTSTDRSSSSNYSFKRTVGDSLVGQDVYVGYAASTGGSNADHEVKKWYFDNAYHAGGLSAADHAYTQAVSTIGITLNGTGAGGATSPSSVGVTLNGATGAALPGQTFHVYIDNTQVGDDYTTGAAGSCTVGIPFGLDGGSHTLRVVSADGSAVNTASFTSPYTVTYAAASNGTLTGASSEQVSAGASPARIPTPQAGAGYSFAYWSPDSGVTKLTPAQLGSQTISANVTYTAYFAPNTYTLSFDERGGSAVSDKQVVFNGPYGALETPGRTGYTFGGWNTREDGQGQTVTSATAYTVPGDSTLYAQWSPETHKLHFDSQGGSEAADQSVTYDAPVGALTTPARTGYDFGGWFTEAGGKGTQYTASTVYHSTADTTLYANWAAKSYTLCFDEQGGGSVVDQSVTYDQKVGALPDASRPGYTFGGWFTQPNGGGTQVTADTLYKTDGGSTIYAKWTPNQYAITIDTQSGTTETAQTVTFNSPVGTLPAPEKEGYTFKGWYTGPDMQGTRYTDETVYTSAAGVTLYAGWEANDYTLHFDAQGGSAAADKAVTFNKAVGTLVTPEKAGYTFGGWFTEPGGRGTQVTDSTVYGTAGDSTVYAKWTANDYTLYFVKESGSPVTSRSVIYDAEVGTLPTPSIDGYTFNGWFTQENGKGMRYSDDTVYRVDGDTTLYADWTILPGDPANAPTRQIGASGGSADLTVSDIAGIGNGNVGVTAGRVTISIPAAVVDSQTDSDKQAHLRITVTDTPQSSKPALKNALPAGADVLDSFDLTATLTSSDGSSADLSRLDGKVQITVKLTPGQVQSLQGSSGSALYRVDPDTGKLAKVDAAFDAATGTVTFLSEQTGRFVIGFQPVEANPNTGNHLILALTLVALALLAGLSVLLLRARQTASARR